MLHSDRVALVTGAASGTGRAVAARLAARGHRLALADLRPCSDSESQEFLCDIARPDEVERLAAWVLRRFGRCDVLVNGAAYAPLGPLGHLDLPTWRRVHAVNLDAAYQLCAAFAPAMTERGFGRIINLISAGEPADAGYVAYVASKAGLVGLTRSLAAELGSHDITVNAVSHPAGGAGHAPAAMVSFLASDEAALITGQTLRADGGLVTL